MMVGVQDSPYPTEKGVELSNQTTYAFTLRHSHPTLRNLLKNKETPFAWGYSLLDGFA